MISHRIHFDRDTVNNGRQDVSRHTQLFTVVWKLLSAVTLNHATQTSDFQCSYTRESGYNNEKPMFFFLFFFLKVAGMSIASHLYQCTHINLSIMTFIGDQISLTYQNSNSVLF